jgi:hypothetical protein
MQNQEKHHVMLQNVNADVLIIFLRMEHMTLNVFANILSKNTIVSPKNV